MNTLTPYQSHVAKILRHSTKESPVTGRTIGRMVGIQENAKTDGANLRSVIHALRVKGFPICADSNGYFWAGDAEELQEFIISFQGRVDEQQKAVDGLRASYDKVGAAPEPKQGALI